jgi:hypothetical protein
MSAIDLARGDYSRRVAAEPYIALKNRFCEANPALTDDPITIIARPALKKWIDVGTGPIRKTFSEPGVFDGDLFVVSDDDLYRVSAADGTADHIGDIGNATGDVSMAATAPIGAETAHLFIANGGVLWLYMETAQATGTLTASAIADTDVVRIDAIYYKFTNGAVDTGTPAGTLANPWLVARSGTLATDLATLVKAINGTGVAGTDYSTGLVAHTTVTATSGATTLIATAIAQGPTGNTIVTTETGANTAWGGGTLSGGGIANLTQVTMPDDVGAISVAHINSYVIVIPLQDEEAVTIGRFYWINPGEITIDSGDFATAERAPDALHQVIVSRDMFWLFGQKTIEPWVARGAADAPMERFRGIIWEHGSWEGTALDVRGNLFHIDENGRAYLNDTVISRPDIEERIRRAIQRQSTT